MERRSGILCTGSDSPDSAEHEIEVVFPHILHGAEADKEMHRRLVFHSTNSLLPIPFLTKSISSFSQISQNSRKVGTFTDPGYRKKRPNTKACNNHSGFLTFY